MSILSKDNSTKIQEPKNIFPQKSWERITNVEAAGYSTRVLSELEYYAEKLHTTGLMVIIDGKVLFEYGNLTELSYLASSREVVKYIRYS